MKGHLIWLLRQTRAGQRLLTALFCVVGLGLIALGILASDIFREDWSKVDFGLLALLVAVGLFWILMGLLHALIGVVRGRL